ncbi:hypothetical protein D3C83_275080 [compost metagenome]
MKRASRPVSRLPKKAIDIRATTAGYGELIAVMTGKFNFGLPMSQFRHTIAET